MKKVRIWLIRIIVIALLLAAVIKSPTAFVAALLGVVLAGYLFIIWPKWKFWRIVSAAAPSRYSWIIDASETRLPAT